jgi:hypothetical protein
MAKLAEVRKETGETGPPPPPPLAWWSAEVDALADVRDSILELKDTLLRVNVPKGSQNSIPAINWTRRPGDDRGKATKFAEPTVDQEAKHRVLVSKLLPHKAQESS